LKLSVSIEIKRIRDNTAKKYTSYEKLGI